MRTAARGGILLAAVLIGLCASPIARAQDDKPRSGETETAADLADLRELENEVRRSHGTSDLRAGFSEYLSRFPESARALTLRALFKRRLGDYDGAEEDLAHARRSLLDEETRRTWAVTAFDLHLERGDFAAMERDLAFGTAETDAVAPHDPAAAAAPAAAAMKDAHLASRRVVLLAALGRRKEAAEVCRESFRGIDPRKAEARLEIEHGRALLALHDLERAAQVLVPAEKALRDARDVLQAEALVLLGNVYTEGRSQGDMIPALGAHAAALEVDPGSTSAFVGRARAYIYRMDFDQADHEIDQALARNEHLPDANSARAELLLYDQRPTEAGAAADAALAVNPNHLAALACKAAALWLLGRKDESEQVVLRFATAAPGDADGLRRLADILCYLYRFRDAIPFYRRALAVDENWTTSYVGLSRCLVNTGDLRGALTALHEFRARDRDPYPLADNTAKALHTLEGFVEVPRGVFTYFMDPLESPVLVPLLEQLYATEWASLCSRYGFDANQRVRVECFPRHDDFSARTVGFTGFGALGVCFGNVFTLLSPRSEMRGQFPFDRTAVHELTHVVTLGLSENKVPRWLTEGISVHEEHVFAKNGDREMDLELYDNFKSGDIVPVRELNRLFGGPRIMFGYYEGGLLVDFLVERSGESVIVEMLKRFARDQDTPEVVQAVLGMAPEELDRQFLAWIERTKIAAMKVQATYNEAGRRRLLERAAASEKPDADLLAQIAWAYHRAGRAVDRDDYLHRALTLDPKLPSAHFLLAERAFAARRRDEGRRELELGFQDGGEEFWALMHYAELLAHDDPTSGLFDPQQRPRRRRGTHGRPNGAAAAAAKDDLTPAQRASREQLLEVLGHAQRCFPRYVGENNPYVLRARLLDELGREDDALRELRAYCDIHESDGDARAVLVQRALERKDFAEAEHFLLELRALDPFQRGLLRELARCQKELGRPADAIATIKLALAVDPATEPDYSPAPAREEGLGAKVRDAQDRELHADLLLDLAELDLAVGEKESAQRALEEARALAPDSARLETVEREIGAASGG